MRVWMASKNLGCGGVNPTTRIVSTNRTGSRKLRRIQLQEKACRPLSPRWSFALLPTVGDGDSSRSPPAWAAQLVAVPVDDSHG